MLLLAEGRTLMRGPPPQAVIEKRCLWQVLICGLALLTVMRLLAFDIIGAFLSGLMLSMAATVVADGMEELPKYALVFAILSMLCFVCDVVPLLTSLDGRSITRVTPDDTEVQGRVTKLTYTTTTKTTPFFDEAQGFVYNIGSCAMIVAPITNFLGSWLGFHAHFALEEMSLAELGDPGGAVWDTDEPGAARFQELRDGLGRQMGAATATERRETGGPGGQLLAAAGPAERFQFQGKPHRLDD